MSDDLAIDGGSPVRSEPFPPRQLIGNAERGAVDSYLSERESSGTPIEYQGAAEEAYCEAFADQLGGGYADAVNSGTAAIYVALRALDLEPFSEVIVSPITDPGGQMPVALQNCVPIVADSAPGSYNTGPEQIEACITPRTSAICVGHIMGEPLDMPGIMAVADEFDLPVIEDAAQAHGAELDGRPVGTFGDIAAFSTMYGKHYATGGQGGVVYTQDRDLYDRVRRAADRGKPFGLDDETGNVIASLNFNLDELAATIGRAQLDRLPEIVANRRDFVNDLGSELTALPGVEIPEIVDGAAPSYWFWRLRVDPTPLSCSADRFCKALAAEGLPVTPRYDARPHTAPWFTEQRVFGSSGYPWQAPAYDGDPDPAVSTPNADAAIEACFNLTIHETWGTAERTDILHGFEKVSAACSR